MKVGWEPRRQLRDWSLWILLQQRLYYKKEAGESSMLTRRWSIRDWTSVNGGSPAENLEHVPKMKRSGPENHTHAELPGGIAPQMMKLSLPWLPLL